MNRRIPVLLVLALSGCPAPNQAQRAEEPAAEPVPWHREAVFYEVFVRSFQDSDGDGIGDLPGLISRLDYLNDGRPGEGDDLEVDAIWLMPVFESPSYHGYDTLDYLQVDPHYGTNDDLERLFREADARGMKVILDLVLNHSSAQHPWFEDAVTGIDAEYRDYYVWRDDNPGWTQPWGGGGTWHKRGDQYYYAVFWQGMPDLNYRNPAVVAQMNAVARHWVERGAAGYRIDAARYLVEDPRGLQADQPETHTYFQGLRAELDGIDDEHVLVAEAWTAREDVATYAGAGDEFHLAFDFDLAKAIERTLNAGNRGPLSDELGKVQDWTFGATFLNNHDMVRLADRLRRDGAERAAATILLTLPGTPFLYYGDELGMAQGTGGGDEAKRTPMAWGDGGFTKGAAWYPHADGWESQNVAEGRQDPGSLWSLYQTLLRERRAHPALRSADVELLDTEPGLLAYLRRAPGETMLVAVNVAGRELVPEVLELTGMPKIQLPTLRAGGSQRLVLSR